VYCYNIDHYFRELEIKMAAKKKTTKKKVVKKKTAKKKVAGTAPSGATTMPKFPYATTPNALRRFFELVPQKPKPAKINADALKAWGLRNTNDATIIRVLKALGFVGGNNEPTDLYTSFMAPGNGPGILADAIRSVWGPLFEHSHEPHREDDPTLRNYFNIHSGGSEATVALQIQTFKAACDHADFSVIGSTSTNSTGETTTSTTVSSGTSGTPQIHIDLHIHLPENKSRRDYEYIFEDIARYIFGKETPGSSDDR